jgi:biopolymer transport protein TolR
VSHKPSALQLMAAPNVIPMADIMLVLLIIFMVIIPIIQNHSPVDMAKAENASKMPNADRDDAIVLAVTRSGSFFLSPGNKQIGLNEIADDVKSLTANRLDRTVYVRSDARAKYSDVVRAIDQIRSTGVENIGLLTEKIPNKPPSPPDGKDLR